MCAFAVSGEIFVQKSLHFFGTHVRVFCRLPNLSDFLTRVRNFFEATRFEENMTVLEIGLSTTKPMRTSFDPWLDQQQPRSQRHRGQSQRA